MELRPAIRVATESGIKEDIEVGVEELPSPEGLPRWNNNVTPKESLQEMSRVGRAGHDAVEESGEFNYENVNRKIGESGRPDGWTIDHLLKRIKIGEIKSATKTGFRNGLRQLARYVADARAQYPDYDIQADLFLYRVVVGYIVNVGDNLSKIANAHNLTLEQLYEMNPQIDRNTSKIYPKERIVIKIDQVKPQNEQNNQDENQQNKDDDDDDSQDE